jgi:hypothetical protein
MKIKVYEGMEGLYENGMLLRLMVQYHADIFAVSSPSAYCPCM